MTGSFFHQGWEADEDPPKADDTLELTDVTSFPEGGLAPAIEHRLEELNVPIPQEINLGQALNEAEEGTPIPVYWGGQSEPNPGEAATTAEPTIEPRWRVPGENGVEVVPEKLAKEALEAGCSVINSDADLRAFVEARGYALVPLDELDTVVPGKVETTGNPKDLLGIKKPDLSLVPPAAGLYTALAFADGAAKYGPYNWRENPVKARVYIAAALRHIGQYLDGENIDPVSGVPHLGHALACFSILADAEELGNLIDDRPVRGPAGDLIRRLTKD